MVLVCSQHQHELTPQAHFPEDDLKLASDLRTARNLMFQLFQQKTAEMAAAYPNEANPDRLYLKASRSRA